MIGKHCGKSLITIRDEPEAFVKYCSVCGAIFKQRKRVQVKTTLYYIYFDKESKLYAIYQSKEKGLVGEYDSTFTDYYFACFSRLLDASRYVTNENKFLGEMRDKFSSVRNPIA